MDTRRLTIKEIAREHPLGVVKPADFVTEDGPVISPEAVLADPRLSVYCFDPENDRVLFVEVDDAAAVVQAPFYYQGQIEHAVGLVSMPVEVFHRIAATIPEPPRGVIFVHSVGRCGSTLLSKVLAACPTVHSLSEPDDLTQIVNLRVANSISEDEIREMIRSSIKWRGKPREGADFDFLALKTRSEVMVLADLFAELYRSSKHLFLYRDGVSWMRTLFRGIPLDWDIYDEAQNRDMNERWAKMLPLAKQALTESKILNPIEVRILAWITCMEGYLLLKSKGLDLCATRYEDITTDPTQVMRKLLDFCGIDVVDMSRDILLHVPRNSANGLLSNSIRHRRSRPENQQIGLGFFAAIGVG